MQFLGVHANAGFVKRYAHCRCAEVEVRVLGSVQEQLAIDWSNSARISLSQ